MVLEYSPPVVPRGMSAEARAYLTEQLEEIAFHLRRSADGALMPDYGETYKDDDATATNCAATANWYLVAGGYTVGALNGFTHSGGVLTCTNGGTFRVNCIFACTNNNDNLWWAIYKNTTKQGNLQMQNFDNAGSVRPHGALSGILELAAGDTVELRVRDVTQIANITVNMMNLSLVQIA